MFIFLPHFSLFQDTHDILYTLPVFCTKQQTPYLIYSQLSPLYKTGPAKPIFTKLPIHIQLDVRVRSHRQMKISTHFSKHYGYHL